MTTPKPLPVVVGVDGSPSAGRAAAWAAAEADRRGTGLLLVHAYAVPIVGFGGAAITPSSVLDTAHGWGGEILKQAKRAIADMYPGLPTSTVLRRESPVALLKQASRSAQLTVVGSHGSHQFAESILGSVAARIAGHVAGPVVVIRTDPVDGPAHGEGPVVVGLDGSPDSDLALAFAFEEAELRRTPLVAMRVWDDTMLNGSLRSYSLDLDRDRIDRDEGAALADQLTGWTEKHPGVTVEPVVRRGRPADAFLRFCRNHAHPSGGLSLPSLLVMGSRGRGGFTGLLLGSTSAALIAHAPCPVAVVRPPKPEHAAHGHAHPEATHQPPSTR